MISCDAPIQKLNYIFSCHLLAQVQIKIGRLEGERLKPSYKDLLENPLLNYSGVFQHLDLYVTTQIFANNQALCIPVKTSYKYIDKQPWIWEEWLTLPLKISDLPRNAMLSITAWDIESPQRGDVPVCGGTLSLFDKYGEFRQGVFELRMWPNKVADGSLKTKTPGILSDSIDFEQDEITSPIGNNNNNNTESDNNGTNQSLIEEFPILDELDRLAKMSKMHANGHMIKQDWLDRLTLKEIQNATKKEKENSKFFYMSIEFAQIKCEDVKYIVLYYEEDADRVLQTIPTNELFVVNDPELELDNIIELKNRKLEHSKQMVMLDMNLKPDTDNKNLLTKIVNYPVTRTLKREEQALMWKYRYYLTQNKKALTKFLQCFDLNLEFEGKMLMELMLKWQPMDVEDALELLGSKYRNYPKIRSYAVSRLMLASNDDLILYLLQLVQALRYENFNLTNNSNHHGHPQKSSNITNIKPATPNDLLNNNIKSQNSARKNSLKQKETNLDSPMTTTNPVLAVLEDQNTDQLEANISNLDENPNFMTSPSQPLGNNDNHDSLSKRTFELNLKTFLLKRATQNEVVALSLYWFVKVEIKDTKILPTSTSNSALNSNNSSSNSAAAINTISSNTTMNNGISSASNENISNSTNTSSNAANNSSTTGNSNNNNASNDMSKSNFQMFMDELLDSLRNGDAYARSIYENIINQEKFLKALNDVVKLTSKESGGRDRKVLKLRQFLVDTVSTKTSSKLTSSSSTNSSDSFDLVNFNLPIPLISDPDVRINGTNIEKTTMFKSNLMPCKFCFKTTTNQNNKQQVPLPFNEYSVIYKIGDDLRQDQLVLQMIALMDKLLKQENLDLKLTPYKVVATGIKEGFLQFIDAVPVSTILSNEYRTIKEYLRKHNPSETEKYGITSEAMDNYVRSIAGYMVITYILGIGDRHYDNILITKCGKIVHIDFGYILGREPKPFQPIVKWTKDMADGMGGKYGPDGKENKEYEDFKKYCYNAFLHLRRHANLILNLFSLMVDANIPDIALEPDKTVKKLIDRFKLDVSDEQASGALLKEIENNYDTIVGSITDIIHGYAVAQK